MRQDLEEKQRHCDFGVGGQLGVVVPCAAKGTTLIIRLRCLVGAGMGACVHVEMLAGVGARGG